MKNLFQLVQRTIFLALICSTICTAQQIPDGPYLGQKPPGMKAEIFAPGIISLDRRFEHGATFSPDGKEFFYTITNVAWSSLTLMYMREENGQWTSPTKAPFSGTSDNGEALFSPDGQKLYFLSTRSPGYKPYGTDIWMTQRIEKGWSEPIHLGYPVNSTEKGTWHPTVTSEGTLYFSSRRSGGTGGGDIYRAKLVDNSYPIVENVGEPVNTRVHDADAFIAPDESYIIFHSTRSGGYGNFDLYISFQNGDSSWTEPQNMGPGINTSDLEHSPTVTIDGKYLFFGRRNDQSGNGDIYWVNGKVIDELRPSKPDTTSGQHSVSRDATDEQGRIVSSGLHFHQISTPEFTKRKKMMLLK